VTRSLQAILLALLATLALGVAACGGGGDEASSDTDVNTLLTDTFKGNKDVKSGKLNLALKVDAKGAEGVNGPITISVAGPFQSQGKSQLPKFDIKFAFEGAGQSIKAGLTSTGDKGFVNFQGTNYVVSDQVFQQFKAGYEQAQKNGSSKKQTQSLSSLGLDPRQWLTNPKNEGDAKVGDDDTIKITGGVDVNKLLDDVNQALQKTKQLGVQGTQQLPSQLTDAQRKQVTESIKDPKVEIYTGKDDKILRRMVISLGIVPPKNSGTTGSATINFDLSISDLNKDQEISEPSGAQPFDKLLSQLGGLGLGGLGASGGAGSTGSSGSGSSSGTGSTNSKNLEKYSKCVSDAGGDVTKARKCADLLTSP
jgi:hypothetical protein